MKNSKYLEDLKDIKDLMNKSSKFISLSGWSGISIGIIALISAYFAYTIINVPSNDISNSYEQAFYNTRWSLLIIAIVTLILSLLLGIIFTYNKSKRIDQKIWTDQTKTLLLNLFLPLSIGALCCLVLFLKGLLILIAPFTLIFYGLSLINASKYTLNEIRSLGMFECLLGVISLYFTGYGLLFWATGFGILHIVYGVIMKIKYN